MCFAECPSECDSPFSGSPFATAVAFSEEDEDEEMGQPTKDEDLVIPLSPPPAAMSALASADSRNASTGTQLAARPLPFASGTISG